jgi:hypothetical protein
LLSTIRYLKINPVYSYLTRGNAIAVVVKSESVLCFELLYVKVYDRNQMVSSTFDPIQFKMAQREGWDSVAEGWKEWLGADCERSSKDQSTINQTC